MTFDSGDYSNSTTSDNIAYNDSVPIKAYPHDINGPFNPMNYVSHLHFVYIFNHFPEKVNKVFSTFRMQLCVADYYCKV